MMQARYPPPMQSRHMNGGSKKTIPNGDHASLGWGWIGDGNVHRMYSLWGRGLSSLMLRQGSRRRIARGKDRTRLHTRTCIATSDEKEFIAIKWHACLDWRGIDDNFERNTHNKPTSPTWGPHRGRRFGRMMKFVLDLHSGWIAQQVV